MTQRPRNMLIHILGCIVFLSLPILFSPDLNQAMNLVYIEPFRRDLLSAVFLLGFFYLNYYVLIPRFYIPKKIVLYVTLIIVSFLLVSFIPELLISHHPRLHEPNHFNPPPRKGVLFFLSHKSLDFIIVLVLSLLLKIRERLKKTEIEKANAELSYLKAQINPHFLFNTLNSIYALAIQKNEKTADAVVKLSDMMRYVLNDSNTNFVSLEKEINYISNYIELQRMRLTSNVKLSYTLKGNIFDKTIAPLVLIPFIENAFKHGVNSEENSDIDIRITVLETELILMVKNNCVLANNNDLNKSGLGIENTKQRLKLLYPQQHQLNITEAGNCFIVTLSLNLYD